MRTTLVLCALAVAFLTMRPSLSAGDKKKEGKDAAFDVAKLVGKWQYISGEKGGAKVDEKGLKKQTVTITKETWTLKGEGKDDPVFVMKYEVDAKKDPATIKLTMTESPFGAGAVAKGIIELKGDQLRICYDAADGAAPKTFETKEGDKTHLFVLKRAK